MLRWFCHTLQRGKCQRGGKQVLYLLRVGCLQPSHGAWESPGSPGRGGRVLRAHPSFSFPPLTYRMAHSSANDSEGLAQSKNVSILAGTRQTLLLPSKSARLVITTDFANNVLEFQLSPPFFILEKIIWFLSLKFLPGQTAFMCSKLGVHCPRTRC